MAVPDKAYVTLEPLDTRGFASTDPRGRRSQSLSVATNDEVQQVPDLLSYLQDKVNRDPTPGRFILTGSQNLALFQAASRSLVGRGVSEKIDRQLVYSGSEPHVRSGGQLQIDAGAGCTGGNASCSAALRNIHHAYDQGAPAIKSFHRVH